MKIKTLEERKKLICELFQDDMYVPMKEKELAVFLRVGAEDREILKQALTELLAEGKIEISKRGRYTIAQPKKEEAIVGTFISHPKGFGFV